MVSTASTAAQASEMEKKRKQTLERAKANHVSVLFFLLLGVEMLMAFGDPHYLALETVADAVAVCEIES